VAVFAHDVLDSTVMADALLRIGEYVAANRMRVAAESLERKLESKEGVPLIEDFPLATEEEAPDFRHLAFTLQLRLIRAMEHWRGNTDLTLTALIMRTVQEGVLAGERFAAL
jgi:hypothetical protein